MYPGICWTTINQSPLVKKKKKIFFFKPQALNHFHITLNVDQICKKYRIYKALDITSISVLKKIKEQSEKFKDKNSFDKT